MILALNIGNSNITFGSYTPDGKLVFSSRLFADTALSSDELLPLSSFPVWCPR